MQQIIVHHYKYNMTIKIKRKTDKYRKETQAYNPYQTQFQIPYHFLKTCKDHKMNT